MLPPHHRVASTQPLPVRQVHVRCRRITTSASAGRPVSRVSSGQYPCYAAQRIWVLGLPDLCRPVPLSLGPAVTRSCCHSVLLSLGPAVTRSCCHSVLLSLGCGPRRADGFPPRTYGRARPNGQSIWHPAGDGKVAATGQATQSKQAGGLGGPAGACAVRGSRRTSPERTTGSVTHVPPSPPFPFWLDFVGRGAVTVGGGTSAPPKSPRLTARPSRPPSCEWRNARCQVNLEPRRSLCVIDR